MKLKIERYVALLTVLHHNLERHHVYKIRIRSYNDHFGLLLVIYCTIVIPLSLSKHSSCSSICFHKSPYCSHRFRIGSIHVDPSVGVLCTCFYQFLRYALIESTFSSCRNSCYFYFSYSRRYSYETHFGGS